MVLSTYVSNYFRPLQVLLLICMASLLIPAWAAEQPVDAAAVNAEPLTLTEYVGLLEDPERSLTITDVQKPEVAARFNTEQPAGSALALGFTHSAYWLRLTLRNSSDVALQRMLVVENPLISHVQAQLPNTQGGFQAINTGGDTPFATRVYPNRNFVFPLTLPAHAEQVVYLRMESSIGLLIPLQLWSPQAFHAFERNDYLLKAWYFGIASAMVLFNLMLCVFLRDRIYLLYVSFVVCMATTLAIKNGLASEFLWANTFLNSNVGYYSGVSLSVSALLLFMRRMLRTDQVVPRLDRLILALVVVYLLTPLAYALALPVLSQGAILLNLATAPVFLIVGVVCAYKRQRSAYFFLLAFAMLFLGGAMTTLRAMGVLPTNVFTVDGLQFGSSMEMLLLAFALADRVNVMRRDQASAQRELLQAQQLLVDTLKRSERELEQRVAQRTSELQVLNAKLEALSLTDGLTGISNRRRFDEVLLQEWSRAQRLGQPLALAMLDVDWFKKYNDHYGHQAGDLCLRNIAQTLSSKACRTGDLVARYGGEEFAFIAPATDGASALSMAYKVVTAIEAAGMPHALSPLGRVTVSVGVVSMVPTADGLPEALVHRADAALYQAKAMGRNRAELAID